ncbi:MAG TPA: hypothetical protein VKO83_13210 [Steroidobacteraceae bacterium]|nr:hypothetical protein [Steroidobacteraceae bacterium]
MMHKYLCLLAGITMTACASDSGEGSPKESAAAPAAEAGCIAGGGGALQAQLRGALTADLNWANEVMRCEGGARPDGHGLRVTLAGPLPGAAAGGSPARQLRFIFGIDYKDLAAGSAQALPTNVTVILEGEGRIFATRGADRCAVESLERVPLLAEGGRFERVHVRGYCTAPAAELSGDARLLLPTFEFTGRVAAGDAP